MSSTMEGDRPSPAVLNAPVSSSVVDDKGEMEDEQRKESVSILDTEKPLSTSDGDTLDEETAALTQEDSSAIQESLVVNDSIEEMTKSDVQKVEEDNDSGTGEESESTSSSNDERALNSEESLGGETGTTTTENVARASPLEAEEDDLGQLVLQKRYSDQFAARSSSLEATVHEPSQHSFQKKRGENAGTDNPVLLKQRMAGTIPNSSANSNSNTRSSIQNRPGAFPINNPFSGSSTQEDNTNEDEAANIDAAPLASVVLARQSTVTQDDDDPEVGHRVLEAVCVEDQNIVEAKIVAFDGIENPSDLSPKRKRYSIIAAIIILGAIIITTIAVVTTRQQNIEDSQKETPKTDNGGNQPQNISPDYDMERAEKLKTILAPLSGVDVFNEQSPEFSHDRLKALAWLANDNSLSLDDPSIEWKIRQRYVVALLHTSTNGWNWDTQYFFLSENDECQWAQLSAGVDDQDPFSEGKVLAFSGVLCNQFGRVDGIRLRWNNLVGTIPHELSELSNSLSEIDLRGGSISGQIPQSFEQLKALKKLILQDNCLTGAIPDFSLNPNLHTILIGNNAGLSGSLNDYCIGTEKVDSIRNLYADCGREIDCDCCGCCDPDTFECCSEERGCFMSARLNPVPDETYLMAFRKTCLSEISQSWIKEECPCYVSTQADENRTGWDWGFKCTNYCDAKGAFQSTKTGY